MDRHCKQTCGRSTVNDSYANQTRSIANVKCPLLVTSSLRGMQKARQPLRVNRCSNIVHNSIAQDNELCWCLIGWQDNMIFLLFNPVRNSSRMVAKGKIIIHATQLSSPCHHPPDHGDWHDAQKAYLLIQFVIALRFDPGAIQVCAIGTAEVHYVRPYSTVHHSIWPFLFRFPVSNNRATAIGIQEEQVSRWPH
jgi:hypothetical protein